MIFEINKTNNGIKNPLTIMIYYYLYYALPLAISWFVKRSRNSRKTELLIIIDNRRLNEFFHYSLVITILSNNMILLL